MPPPTQHRRSLTALDRAALGHADDALAAALCALVLLERAVGTEADPLVRAVRRALSEARAALTRLGHRGMDS
jgi:hypothetical protein